MGSSPTPHEDDGPPYARVWLRRTRIYGGDVELYGEMAVSRRVGEPPPALRQGEPDSSSTPGPRTPPPKSFRLESAQGRRGLVHPVHWCCRSTTPVWTARTTGDDSGVVSSTRRSSSPGRPACGRGGRKGSPAHSTYFETSREIQDTREEITLRVQGTHA